MTEPARRRARIARPAHDKTIVGLTALGLVAATGPAWMFALAAATVGPRTAVIIYTLPVLASTVLAIWSCVALERRGAPRARLFVGTVALLFGMVMYVVWAYLAVLGIEYGDGPL